MFTPRSKSGLLSLSTFTAVAALSFGSINADAAVVSGTLYNPGGNSTIGTIDFWSFTQTAPGITTLDILSWEAFPTFGDIQIWLFNGSATAANFLAANDDSASTLGDGSTSGLDSFLSVTLPAGNYTVGVARCCTLVADITDDFQQASTRSYSGAGGSNSNETSAQYQLTVLGSITGLATVPEPGSVLLAGLSMGALALRRRRA